MRKIASLLLLLLCGCVESESKVWQVKVVRPDGTVHKTEQMELIGVPCIYSDDGCMRLRTPGGQPDLVAPAGWNIEVSEVAEVEVVKQ